MTTPTLLTTSLAGDVSTVVVALLIVCLLAAGVVTLLKAKWGTLAVGVVSCVWIVGALRLARPRSWWARHFYREVKIERARARQASRRYRALVVAGLAFSLVLSVAFFGLFNAYRIPSSAMEPTLRCASPSPGCTGESSDRVLALRYLPGEVPGRRDVVVFETPPAARAKCGAGGTFVKRIIGLPGERLQIRIQRGAAFVSIDGERLEEPYIEHDLRDIGPAETFAVPPGHYFVMGDNRSQSCDSRVWGSLRRENVLSHVVFRYWPLNRIGTP